jgi:site-specific recombinase XerD
MKLKFLVRQSKMGSDGTSPIELSIIIDGKRKIVSLDRRTTPSKWDATLQRVKGNKEINEFINSIRAKCYTIQSEILLSNQPFTLETFVDVFKNGNRRKSITIDEAFTNIIQTKSSLSKSTINKYTVTLRYFKKFLKEKFNNSDILVHNITPNMCQLFFNYLLNIVSNNTAIYRIKYLNTVLKNCIDEGYIHSNPCKVKYKKDKIEYNPLTKEDINKLINKEFNNKRLNQVRDLFVLQCHTGLSYADLATLSIDDIKGDVIIKNRLKTNIQSVIPILDITREILEKYNYKLPILSNQKYNAYLKEIGDICGLKQELHTHLARHTMATICINNGINVNIIAKMLGHSTSRTTLYVYAHLLNDTVVNEKDRLNEIFKVDTSL